jgi:hypothetical protein
MQPNAAQSAGAFLSPRRSISPLARAPPRRTAERARSRRIRVVRPAALQPGRGGERCMHRHGGRPKLRSSSRPRDGARLAASGAGAVAAPAGPLGLAVLDRFCRSGDRSVRGACGMRLSVRGVAGCCWLGLRACFRACGTETVDGTDGRTDALADMCLVCRRGSSIQSRSSGGGCDVMLARFLFPSPRRPSVLARDLSGSNT